MRTELLQERAIKQDLECDKISLERQVIIIIAGMSSLWQDDRVGICLH